MASRGVDEKRAALDKLPEPLLIMIGPEDTCLQSLLHMAAVDRVSAGLRCSITRLTHQICQQTKSGPQVLLIAHGAHAVLEDGFDAAAVKVAQPFLTTQTRNKVSIARLMRLRIVHLFDKVCPDFEDPAEVRVVEVQQVV